MIRLHLLGAIDLRDKDGREVRTVLAQPKRLALLAYLAVASPPGPHRRDTLLGLFWPELDQDHARNALSKAVHFLRRSLGDAALVSRSADELGLDDAVIWTDAAAFGAAVDGGRTDEALGLYRGDLLPSFFVPDAPGFEDWLERERTGLRLRAAEAARVQAERYESGGDPTRAIECGRRAVALSNGDERPLRRLVELLDRLGDRSGALHAYDSFARRLAVEFEVRPSAETVTLVERIRAADPPRATPNVEQLVPKAIPSPQRLVEPEVAPRGALLHWPRRWALAAAVAGLAAVGTLLSVRLFRSAPTAALDADLVAVAPFDVLDPTLALWREGIVDVLARDLDGAGPLHTVSPTVAIRRWSGRAEAGAAQALGRRTGARLVVFGQVIRSGADSVRLRATLVDASGGRTLGDVELRDAASHMDGLLESLIRKLLQELGRDRPVGAVRQASVGSRPLPALKVFLRGEQYYRRAMWDSALVQYDHAIALDSGFALAYHRMAQVVGWDAEQSNRYADGAEYAQRAALLNQGQTTKDSLLLMVGGFGGGGQLDPENPAYFTRYRQHLAVLEQATRLYPGDPEVWYELGEARYHPHYSDNATLAEPLDAFDRSIELDPAFGPAYMHTVGLALALGMPNRARSYAAAYLSSTPTASPIIRLDALLLDPTRAGSVETARLIDTLGPIHVWNTMWDLSQWPDSAETAVRLARDIAARPSRYFPARFPLIADSFSRRAVLARMLAFRGRLDEAIRTAPTFVFGEPMVWQHPFADLALLGVVPPDSAAAVFGRVLRSDSLWPLGGERSALPWWSATRDTTSLARFARRADSGARHHRNPVAGAHLRGLADAARAYIILAKGDSAAALRAFAALPDSVCTAYVTDCFFEKLTQVRLAAALGQDRIAAETFDRWILGRHLSPVGVLATLEHGRIAERLGQRHKAIQTYRFVADVWRNADPELQPYVAEARAGLKRLVGEVY